MQVSRMFIKIVKYNVMGVLDVAPYGEYKREKDASCLTIMFCQMHIFFLHSAFQNLAKNLIFSTKYILYKLSSLLFWCISLYPKTNDALFSLETPIGRW